MSRDAGSRTALSYSSDGNHLAAFDSPGEVLILGDGDWKLLHRIPLK